MPRVKKTIESLTLPVFDTEGKETGTVTLSKDIFGIKPNKPLIAQAVRVYLANQRQGTADTKTRGEVRGGGRKPWKQKGTGRARQGSTRAPHWKGGGVAFGPEPKDYSLNITTQMRRIALFSALTLKLKDSKIKIFDNLDGLEGKTKNMALALKANGLSGKILLSLPKDSKEVLRTARNIENLEIIPVNLINTYTVLNNKNLLFLKDSLTLLEKTFLTKE